MKNKLIIAFVIVVLLIIGGWYWQNRLQVRNDEQRLRDVEDIMQILIEMRTDQPEWFSQIVGQSAAGQIMIGQGSDCSGDWGRRCAESALKDSCINLTQPFSNYMDSLPVSPASVYIGMSGGDYSQDHTGYYLVVRDQTLEVGACMPEARAEIKLEYGL